MRSKAVGQVFSSPLAGINPTWGLVKEVEWEIITWGQHGERRGRGGAEGGGGVGRGGGATQSMNTIGSNPGTSHPPFFFILPRPKFDYASTFPIFCKFCRIAFYRYMGI